MGARDCVMLFPVILYTQKDGANLAKECEGMKKLAASVLVLICVIGLSGCGNIEQDETTYHFAGEHEYFAISNGSITLRGGDQPFSGGEQNFYGGELTVTQPGIFEDVTSYSTSFYTLYDNGERNQFQSSEVVSQTGVSVPVGEQLGSLSTTGAMISNLEQGLWFELKTIDVYGTKKEYQIELRLS